MQIKAPRLWVLVADSARARAVLWTGRTSAPQSVPDFDLRFHHEHGRDIMAERPGRVRESHGSARHAIEPRADPVREAEQRFTAKVVDELRRRHANDEFDRLFLVAGPTMLGDLRSALSKDLQDIVQGELGKDLTHLTNNQLREHLVADGAV
jgi:protein required for attachment to host cells